MEKGKVLRPTFLYISYATRLPWSNNIINPLRSAFVSTSNSFLRSSLHSIPKAQSSSVSAPRRIPTTKSSTRSIGTLSADMASQPLSLYEVLGIPISAASHEIKAAYRKLARTCHPDVAAVNHRDTSTTEFVKIHAAYSTLSDPNKRAVYDRDLFNVRHRFGRLSGNSMAAAVSGFDGYRRRNWETDQCW